MEYYINLIFSLFMFITGTLFGSFFTLATYRIPRHQDIVKTRSYCPNCKHKLGFFDCFPILSYVSTIGRCRYCAKPISIRYPLIEFASGMAFLLIYSFFGLSWQALVLIVCYVYLFLVVGSDIMKSKMTEEEIKEAEAIVAKKKTGKSKKNFEKKTKKAGAINTEILVAVVLFVMFFISTIFVTRNYNITLNTYIKKTEALNLCLNNINEAKATSFESLTVAQQPVISTDTINGVEYTLSMQISKYLKEGVTELENAKLINCTVTYMQDGVQESVSLRCIKVKNI